VTQPLSPPQLAAINHIAELRRGVTDSDSASEQLECAVLLLDVYEAILESHGILIYADQEEVVQH
jgi:hypothetical protein